MHTLMSLQQVILSETAIFDVLPSFFYHKNPLVRVAALEVYVRRSYTAYDVLSVQHHQVTQCLYVCVYTYGIYAYVCMCVYIVYMHMCVCVYVCILV